MSGNILKYKGYTALVEYSAEDQVLYGKINGIRDLVSFSSESASEIEREFQNAVDDYLALCAEVGKEPDREYSGTFNVRIKPEIHKQIAIRANHNHRSLNAEVEKAIEYYLKQPEHDVPQEIQITVHQTIQPDQAFTLASEDTWKGGSQNGYNIQRTSPVYS